MTDRNRGMWSCEVCGREFALMHEERYTVREEKRGGLAAAFADTPEPTMWDAFDCPYCGCQNRVIIRKREVEDKQQEQAEDACDECPIQEVCPATWKYGDKCE